MSSAGKIALNIMMMASTNFAEVSKPFAKRRGAFAIVPQKQWQPWGKSAMSVSTWKGTTCCAWCHDRIPISCAKAGISTEAEMRRGF